MQPHIRAIIAASVHALLNGQKVSGLFDHAAGQHLRVAAEARSTRVQGYDGDRDVRFGGTLPEIRETGGDVSLHMEIEGGGVRGYDRSSSGHFWAQANERLVQIYDYAEGAWFAFDVHVA
jgi:hypothetical protein